ncbi:hypothetical protein Ciccas_011907 [Cichlidogyrus casuarinus]|uniref:Uncharacterized protein n=1 Tax=Cichlidogyrus casuarinus TaxID=1844966 RepID=A0ABD2PRM6_9PLAT
MQLRRERRDWRPMNSEQADYCPYRGENARLEWVELAEKMSRIHSSCSSHISPIKHARPKSLETVQVEPIISLDSGIDQTPISTDLESKRAFFELAMKERQQTAEFSAI